MSNLRKKNKKIAGVGINDADYKISTTDANGKTKLCPYYMVWSSMLRRCYSPASLIKDPTYKGCSVIEDWHTFSNFKSWMEQQDWEGKQLDKDILVFGNKLYSPETCVFVEKVVNTFLNDCVLSRGECLIGVHKHSQKFQAQCRDPITKKYVYLGIFIDEMDAHLEWLRYKHQLAIKLASQQDDQRVADALVKRYSTPLENYRK